MVSRKRGPKTYTITEMLEMGYKLVGRFARHRYLLNRRDMHARPDRPYPKAPPTLFAPEADSRFHASPRTLPTTQPSITHSHVTVTATQTGRRHP